MFLFSPEISEKEVKTEVDQTKAIIQELGGEITKEDFWGLKNLAYPIKHQEQGYYQITWCKLAPAKLSALEQKLKGQGGLTRFLVTKLGKKEPVAIKIPSPASVLAQEDFVTGQREHKATPPPTRTVTKAPSKPAKQKITGPLPLPPTKQEEAAKIKKEKSDLQELDKKLDEILNEEVI